ncbi:leucine--tRNA ligase [Patescibacteria group bacterium]|nr:leucine--tRNA ligase [Patescibacteria group bacterium]
MPKETYDHKKIEKVAQEKWDELHLYETDLSDTTKDPYYLLIEYPYPSGDLHTGHWYAFALTDIFARFKRMQGKNVLYPFGFDAFGLPAENAAIKRGLDPKEWTYQNMDTMRTQIKQMGASFDWTKEVVTSDPEYYKWTQWLFSKLFEHGLAERRLAAVKWCPKDQTVLANEQVIDGKCERCGTEVEERNLTQWFLKITQYAKRLLTDLDPLPWRQEIKDAQKAWIGESEGAKIFFDVRAAVNDDAGIVEVFTTRPDTIFGATYIVIAPEHPLVDALMPLASNKEEIENYRHTTARKTERERSENKEKTGVRLQGISAVNPATKQEIPVYIADYVIATYGTGAVMAVPAHDERDFDFAKRFDLPIVSVIESPDPLLTDSAFAYTDNGILTNSGEFTDRDNREAMNDIVTTIGGEWITNYRLRDWLVSRQRYWGCPIPIVYDLDGKAHLVPAEHLPWLLPTDVDLTPTGKSPLASSKELHERVERIFGQGWTPEYDTLDVFVDSSWYFLRYLNPHGADEFSNQKLMKYWLPVDRYSGGSEHTTVHLLYARFFYKALHDLSLVPTSEPFEERFNRGLILGTDGAKMSKSKGNVINPDEFVQKYGADAVRMYLAFIGPYNEVGSYPWNLSGVEAMRRFLDRIVTVSKKVTTIDTSKELARALSRAIEKVSSDTERFKFNTAISALMILINEFEKLPEISQNAFHDFLKLLAPFAPHLAEHLFEEMNGFDKNVLSSIHAELWPISQYQGDSEEKSRVIVQVNGKRRGEIHIASDTSEEEALAAAKLIPAIQTYLEKGTLKRIVYVSGKILNLVVEE